MKKVNTKLTHTYRNTSRNTHVIEMAREANLR